MGNFRRAILIVLDSLGVGALPDAAEYGDSGASTIKSILKRDRGLKITNLTKLGLFNITGLEKFGKSENPLAMFGKMKALSKGKDTMTGHWEMMGLVTKKEFPVFPNGFPQKIIKEFLKIEGVHGYLGNVAASGTEIIKELGEEHIRTGKPIIYTSGDSVFQIAAHEEIIPVDELYLICEKTRNLCDSYDIGRVIARPFTGNNGVFTRTSNRRDYPMEPPSETILEELHDSGIKVTGVGKIEDIFAGKGIDESYHSKDNSDGINILLHELDKKDTGLIFVNLVDFDMKYGHRRDINGYADALEVFDRKVPLLLQKLESDDLLILTADHGCDPGFRGTDHTREYVPLLVYSKNIVPANLGIRKSFSDIGVSILEFFGIENDKFPGESFIIK